MSVSPNAVNTMFERINSLFQAELKNILKQEQNNENRVNLYSVGEYWAAFEKSAYLLEQMIPDSNRPLVLYLKDYPFPVVMHNVHYEKLNSIRRNHIVAKTDMDYLQFVTHPIDGNLYKSWYKVHVVDEN